MSAVRRVCEIARGGMGRVDLVLRQEGRFGRLYALKRLHSVYRDEPDLRAMFLDEARIAGLVRHPNVVSVLDVGEDAEGPYLLMDFVEGVSVLALVSGAGKEGILLPVQLACQILRQAAEGLHAAHELCGHDGAPLGLVHRDVSPQNILVGFDGVVRVTDFGIAKAFGRATQTTTGILKGKVGYMSPEQLRFEEPDRRSDVFSLGVILHELLSGTRLYPSSEGPDSARRILKEPPPDIGEVRDDVPPELVELLFELLAKDPAHRPADARAVARRLEAILTALVVEQGPLRIEDYLEEKLRDQRVERRRALARALETLDGGAWETAATEEDNGTLVQPRAVSPRARWAAIAAAVAVLAIAGTAIWLGTRPAPASTPTAQARTAHRDPVRSTEPTREPTPTSPPPHLPVETSGPPPPEPDPPPPPGRRGQKRRAPSREEPPPGIPHWGWR